MTTSRRVELFVAALWIIAVIAATVQQGITHQNNNFLIFRAASLNLLHGKDLYAAYPALHFDFYKYSPAFALLFLPFAVLPFALSMLLWNALNAASLYVALGMVLPRNRATAARALVFLDMLGSLQNVQSNALVAALIILTFAAYERQHSVLGTAAAHIGAAIKLFPLAAISFAIFHPRKVRVAMAVIIGAVVVIALPLLVTSPHTLGMQYASWRAIETKDALERGFTVMQMIELLFHGGWPNWPQQLGGTLILVAPVLIRHHLWRNWNFRRTYLCSVLVFCVVFNHQSESPTFVIAVTGAALWFAAMKDLSRTAWSLLVFFVIGTILASSDVMPKAIQREVFDAYHAKAIPCIVVWIWIQVRLWRGYGNGDKERPAAQIAIPAY